MASLFAVRRVAGHPRLTMRAETGPRQRQCPRGRPRATATRLTTLLLACPALAGLLACAGSNPQKPAAAQTTSSEDARQYYPLETGWRWAYDVEKAGERILAIYSVIERGGASAVLQAGTERISYLVMPDGIARRAPDKELPQGDYLLRSPIKAGARWPIEGGTATVSSVAQAVTVPAGTFQGCIIVEESRSEPTRLARTTYAPGMGPVVIEYLVHDAATGRFYPALRAALRGVTPPGSDPLQ